MGLEVEVCECDNIKERLEKSEKALKLAGNLASSCEILLNSNIINLSVDLTRVKQYLDDFNGYVDNM